MIRSALLPSLLLLCLSALLPAPATAQTVDRLRIVLTGEQYARKAASHDLYEKDAGALLLKTSRNPAVRTFAQTMMADHARSAAELRAAAAASGVTVNPQLSTIEYKEYIGKLTRAVGDARDAVYLTQHRGVLQRALLMHQDYAAAGDQPALKDVAARLAQMVQGHIAMLDAIPPPPLPVAASVLGAVPTAPR